MERFILATNNMHKLAEMKRILLPLGIDVVSAKEVNLDLGEVEETGTTFLENARIKAKSAFIRTGIPAIADDSGLVVDALNGNPGVYSARYGGEGLTDSQRIDLLLSELKDVPPKQRTARFVCEICCIINDNTEITAKGVCEGVIAAAQSGNGGFGYDPIFFIPQENKTFAELTDADKDSLSHRGKALAELKTKITDLYK